MAAANPAEIGVDVNRNFDWLWDLSRVFDPEVIAGNLLVASEDPTPMSKKHLLQQQEQDIRLGIKSINEVRRERGLPPVPWGDRPLGNTDQLKNPVDPLAKADAQKEVQQANG